MVVWGFFLLVFGYTLAYSGMTGFLSMLSGGKIKKQSVLQAAGVTGTNGTSPSMAAFGLNVNPFVNASALNLSADSVSTSLGVTAQMAPAAFSLGNGQKANPPVTGAQALGSAPASDGAVAT